MSDLISRADAIDALNKEYHGMLSDESMKIYQIKNWLSALPSADKPTGEWIKSHLLPNGWHCSHCDSPVMTDDISEMLYCPNCGARMKGADNE